MALTELCTQVLKWSMDQVTYQFYFVEYFDQSFGCCLLQTPSKSFVRIVFVCVISITWKCEFTSFLGARVLDYHFCVHKRFGKYAKNAIFSPRVLFTQNIVKMCKNMQKGDFNQLLGVFSTQTLAKILNNMVNTYLGMRTYLY